MLHPKYLVNPLLTKAKQYVGSPALGYCVAGSIVVLKVCLRFTVLLAATLAIALPAFAGEDAAQKPLSAATLAFLELKNVRADAPVYIRVFKEEFGT